MIPLTFISASSADYEYAEQIYRFLKSQGVAAFFSKESLPELARSDYRKQIDEALDQAMHMIVVTSSRDHVRSRWVEAEWGLFINEIRSGRKDGNIVTVTVGNLTPSDLPASLRYFEVIPFQQQAFPKLLRYVASARTQPSPQAVGENTASIKLPDSGVAGYAAKPAASQRPDAALARPASNVASGAEHAKTGVRILTSKYFFGATIGALFGFSNSLLAGFYETARFGSRLSPVVPSVFGAVLGAALGLIVVGSRPGRIAGIIVGLIAALVGATTEGPSAAVGMGLLFGTTAGLIAVSIAYVVRLGPKG